MKFDFIDLKAQYQEYKNEIDRAIAGVVESAAFIGGGELSSLEDELASYCGVDYAIGCSSGTSALELSLRALGIGEGDEVITSPFTFFATAEMISIVGAKPVFVDIESKSYNIDISKIEEKINLKTKAIIVVSIFGQMPDVRAILEIAKAHNIPVIEDGAQSFGATYKGEKSCSIATISTTSFFPAKPLGCYGDGGAMFTNDKGLNDHLRALLNHGQKERYKHHLIGTNGRLDALQASILRVKLKYFEDEIAKRESIAKVYDEHLSSVVKTPYISSDARSVYAQYTILTENRDELSKKLGEFGIPTAIHYPIPLYRQDVYKDMSIDVGEFSVSEDISSRVLSLPFSPFLKREHQDFVIEKVVEILK